MGEGNTQREKDRGKERGIKGWKENTHKERERGKYRGRKE